MTGVPVTARGPERSLDGSNFSENERKTLTYNQSSMEEWKGSNRKQSAKWQHMSWLKASAFCIW
jgi:hypothetical protein